MRDEFDFDDDEEEEPDVRPTKKKIGGPNEITGKFNTREELVKEIFRLKGKKYSQRYIANECQISESVVSNIVNRTADAESRFAVLKKKILANLWDKSLKLEELL